MTADFYVQFLYKPSQLSCIGQAKSSRYSMYSPSFVDDSVLDILVPQDSEYDVEKIISSTAISEHEESDDRLFPFISQRDTLHFGESHLESRANH